MCVNAYTLVVDEDTVYLIRFQTIGLFMVNMIKLLIVWLMFVTSGTVYASKERSIEQIQQDNNAARTLQDLTNSIDTLIDDKRADCEKAIGYSPSCF